MELHLLLALEISTVIFLREPQGVTIMTGIPKLTLVVLNTREDHGHPISFGFWHEFLEKGSFVPYRMALPPGTHRR
jgi:hypothetical protein